MSNKKLQVFVSSTFTDLIEERQAAVQAILKAGHIPAGMELFKAGDEEQMKVIERWIDESDVYMLILGGRYGSVDEKSGKSYTQLEYEYALARGKALFAVVVNQPVLDRWVKEFGYEKIEKYHVKELEQFRAEVLKGKVVAFWDDAKDIKLSILEALPEFQYRENLVGWVQGDHAVSGNVAEELARLGKENEEMKSRLNGKNDILYAGLTYLELRRLLEERKVKQDGEIKSLYQILLFYGNELSLVHRETNDGIVVRIFHNLQRYKIIEAVPLFSNEYGFKFTDDGHRFYLKLLTLENEENKSQNLSSDNSK